LSMLLLGDESGGTQHIVIKLRLTYKSALA
jgi:hypothetical protein